MPIIHGSTVLAGALALAGGATLYSWAKARRAGAEGGIYTPYNNTVRVPVDEELNPKPWVTKPVPVETREYSYKRDTRENTTSIGSAPWMSDPVVQAAEQRAHKARDEAEALRREAEKAAAIAAAALASAQALAQKSDEDKRKANSLREEERSMMEAAASRHADAKELERLASKEGVYRADAEHEAKKRLKEEDRELRRAASKEEEARNLALRAEEIKREAAERLERDAAARAAAAARDKQDAAARLAAEKQAAADAARLAEDTARRNQQLLRDQELARKTAADLADKEQALRQQLAEVERSRQSANFNANEASAQAARVERALAAAKSARVAHEEAAARAQDSLRRADALAGAFAEQEREARGWLSRLWTGPAKTATPVIAVADASGDAVTSAVPDPAHTKGTGLGRHVDARGEARVDFVSAPPGDPNATGLGRATLESSVRDSNHAHSHTRVAETGKGGRLW